MKANESGAELFGVDRRASRVEQAKARQPGMVRHGRHVLHWREVAALPPIAAEWYVYEPFGGQGFEFIERRLIRRLQALGAAHFRSWMIRERYDVPAYPLGVYGEGWRVAPADMEPPHREANFWFPLVDGVPLQSDVPAAAVSMGE